jgi:hypothetical protein
MKMRTTRSKASGRRQVLFGLGLLGAALASGFSAGVIAHTQKAAVTRVVFNPRSGNIEFMHRFLVHDAEHAAGMLFGAGQDLLGSAESRELFSSYVLNRFAVVAHYVNGDDEALDLQYVGSEVDGQYLWVYQEIPLDDDISGFDVVNLALRDVWEEQTNLVNIERDGRVYTLLFDGSTEELSIELSPA